MLFIIRSQEVNNWKQNVICRKSILCNSRKSWEIPHTMHCSVLNQNFTNNFLTFHNIALRTTLLSIAFLWTRHSHFMTRKRTQYSSQKCFFFFWPESRGAWLQPFTWIYDIYVRAYEKEKIKARKVKKAAKGN